MGPKWWIIFLWHSLRQDEDEWLLYIFAEGMTRPQVPPHFPPLVEAMLREPRTTVDYQTQRRMWAHAIFFLHREARLLALLMQAQKVSMLVMRMVFIFYCLSLPSKALPHGWDSAVEAKLKFSFGNKLFIIVLYITPWNGKCKQPYELSGSQ